MFNSHERPPIRDGSPASPSGSGASTSGRARMSPVGDESFVVQTSGAPSTQDRSSAGDQESFENRVAKVVEIIRPAIQVDDGDIFLRGVQADGGLVEVELVGACVTCPASTATVKDGLERILKQRVEGATGVVHVGEALVGADEGTKAFL